MKDIISGLVIAVSIGAFVFIVKPSYDEIKELKAEASGYEIALENAKNLQAARDRLIEKQNNFSSADLRKLEKLIPENSDNVKLILELQKIAAQYDLEIQSASTEKEEDGGTTQTQVKNFDIQTRDYGVINMDFTVTGSYENFVSFLESLEQNLRITDLQTLDFGAQNEQTGAYEFSISLKTYWLKDNI